MQDLTEGGGTPRRVGARSLTICLDSAVWEALDAQATHEGLAIGELISFCLLYYMADLDSGRTSRPIASSAPWTNGPGGIARRRLVEREHAGAGTMLAAADRDGPQLTVEPVARKARTDAGRAASTSREVKLSMKGFAREALDREADGHGLTTEELAEFSIRYYLGDDFARPAHRASRSPFP